MAKVSGKSKMFVSHSYLNDLYKRNVYGWHKIRQREHFFHIQQYIGRPWLAVFVFQRLANCFPSVSHIFAFGEAVYDVIQARLAR
jgi:hypothetical protein